MIDKMASEDHVNQALIDLLHNVSASGKPQLGLTRPQGEHYLIGPFAEIVGLEPKTIRFYEKAGLMHPRRIGRYRYYGSGDVAALTAIRKLRQFGLSIADIRSLLPEGRKPCMEHENEEHLRLLLADRLSKLRLQHQLLLQSIQELSGLLTQEPTTNESTVKTGLIKNENAAR